MCELVSLTVEQSLRHDSDGSGVLPQVLHAAEFPSVQQVGGGRSLSSPGREGGGDPQEMSRHRQSLPGSAERTPNGPLWLQSQGWVVSREFTEVPPVS
jgi:hypothetical protein